MITSSFFTSLQKNTIEQYVLTIINMVQGIYHDPSLGNAIHVVLVRLIMLEDEEAAVSIIYNSHIKSFIQSY